MQKYCGYYSLIQYCPNKMLMETVSIGVLLFCPDLNYVNIKILNNNRRIERILGTRITNSAFLQAYKKGLGDKIIKDFSKNVSYESLSRYLKTYINDILFSDIYSTVVSHSPEIDIQNLFVRLFGTENEITDRERQIHRLPKPSTLRRKFFSYVLQHPNYETLQRRLAVPKENFVIDSEHTRQITFAFKNGNYNAVFSSLFADNTCYARINDALRINAELHAQPKESSWYNVKPIIHGTVRISNAQKKKDIANVFRRDGILYFDTYEKLFDYYSKNASDLSDSEFFIPLAAYDPSLLNSKIKPLLNKQE